MKSVLRVKLLGRSSVEPLGIGLVVCKKKLRQFAVRPLIKGHFVLAHHRMHGGKSAGTCRGDLWFHKALLADLPPRPSIAIP